MHECIFPIGPQHPALKEPIYLKLHVEGTTVKQAEFNLGYAHRGVERISEGKLLDPELHTVQRTCGICSHCHSLAFLRAVEPVAGLTIPMKVKLQRVMVAELERIHSHLLWAGVMMHEMGLETLFMYFWRERENILDVFDELTGGRVHHSINLVGTMKRSFNKENLVFAQEKLNSIIDRVKEHREVLENHDVIVSRSKGIGKISKKMAVDLGLVGPVARASGVDYDVRVNSPYEAYTEIKVKPVLRVETDAWARSLARADEILESIKIIDKAIDMIDPNEELPKKPSFFAKEGVGLGRVEAPRGENFHYVKIENNRISRIKLRTPTLANLCVYPKILEDVDITDVPVIVASLDPCISCMERVTVIKDGKKEIWTTHELSEAKKHD
ncbi:MAG: nickel-dependent hydrogenase large subunit [Candidatus Micrarchaeota archaeon]